MLKSKLYLTIPALIVGLSLSACGSDTHEDAEPTNSSKIDRTPATVISMPDGFRNVATKCVPNTGMRIFVTSRGKGTSQSLPSSVSAVEDPSCKR